MPLLVTAGAFFVFGTFSVTYQSAIKKFKEYVQRKASGSKTSEARTLYFSGITDQIKNLWSA
ncbi:hypothetical protein SAMN04487996_1052 [Dyadobacter soli]|uniref:Uncharacterized protein n=1 Tax=Dyadobacter soli TaxID=659014 RepID=A0A1G7CSI7_9BACT|nr:hypothetical protein SAMN04487996_1052 [Dyadobacter soli]